MESGKEDRAEKEISELISDAEVLEMSTFREENKASEKAIRYTLYGCYGILINHSCSPLNGRIVKGTFRHVPGQFLHSLIV